MITPILQKKKKRLKEFSQMPLLQKLGVQMQMSDSAVGALNPCF